MSVHRMLMTMLLLGAAGGLSCVVLFPSSDVTPAADRSGAQGLTVSASNVPRGANGGDTYTPPSGSFGALATSSPTGSAAGSTGSSAGTSPASSPSTAFATPSAGAGASASPSASSGTSAASAASSTSAAASSSATADTSTSPTSVLFTLDPNTATSSSVGVVFPTSPDTSSSAASSSSSASSGTTSAVGTAGLGLGFYDGTSSPAGAEIAATWLGSSTSVKYAQDFIDATDWAHIDDPWQLPNWQGSPFQMVWGVPMLPCGAPSTQCATNVADYNLVADGGADSYYVTLAQNLVAAGFGSSYIRLGWEFNADWMGWGICNSGGTGLTSWAADFVPAFQNIVTSMRSVSGANFKFIWNPIDSANSSCTGASLENFYPGDAYVDAVALDAYDGIGTATSSDAARWTDILNGVNAGGWTAVTPASINGQTFPGYGLTWLAAFAAEHGKEVSLPEWGLMSASTDGGGGDDTTYMTDMTSWIKSNASGPVLFWNYAGGTLPLDIPNYTNGDTPNATAIFQSAFTGGL
jgi:Glycosyl hydrolase family 26